MLKLKNKNKNKCKWLSYTKIHGKNQTDDINSKHIEIESYLISPSNVT